MSEPRPRPFLHPDTQEALIEVGIIVVRVIGGSILVALVVIMLGAVAHG